jgi:hypothetical protein
MEDELIQAAKEFEAALEKRIVKPPLKPEQFETVHRLEQCIRGAVEDIRKMPAITQKTLIWDAYAYAKRLSRIISQVSVK